MDKQEARSLLTEQLATYRTRSYADLVAMIGRDDCVEITGPSGERYQVEFGVIWDNKPGGNVRVMLSIDDGTFRAAFSPLTDDFIKAPDGSFIGES
jgi:hypothetical protein